MTRLRIFAVAAIMAIALTGCGGADTAPSESATASGAAMQTKVVPQLAGRSFKEANGLLNKDGLSAVAVGKNGKEWTKMFPYDAKVISSDPAGGTSTDRKSVRLHLDMDEPWNEAEAAAAAEKAKADAAAAAEKAKADAEKEALAKRYDFTCNYETFKSLEQVWASNSYKSRLTCTVKVAGLDDPELLPSEKAIADIAMSNGGSMTPGATFIRVLGLCAAVELDYADKPSGGRTERKAWAQAALELCPGAPHAQLLRDAVTLTRINDGDHTVGKNMEPGTYKTKPGVKDCYWSRNTGGGDIIDNNFVGYAPDGVTVTTYAGEGFESSRCGVWTKIG